MLTAGSSNVFALTMPAILEQACQRYPQRKAIYFMGQEMDYRTLGEAVTRFAAGLADLQIKKGERIALLLPNCPQYVIAYYGILTAGGIVVQLNPMSVEREIESFLRDSGARVLVVHAPLLKRIVHTKAAADLSKTIVVDFSGEEPTYNDPWVSFSSFLEQARGPVCSMEPEPDDVAVLQYTGGTTGRPKGAMLTHRNIAINAYQADTIMEMDKEEQERILTVLPLFHVFGMTATMNAGVFRASQLIMLPRFTTEEVLRTIQAARPTIFPGVPTMFIALNSHPQAETYGLSTIRLCVSGSAPLPMEVLQEFERKAQCTLIEGYGLSEASPITHFNPLDRRKPGSIGMPIPFTEAKIVDLEDDTKELPPNEVGELLVRGPQVMKGYWNMPEETERVLRGGWLHTGDIARKDEEGYYYIVDRRKDMIIAGGYNVYPREVEEVLYQHPAIQEAAVVGVPDAYRGETVKAFIVRKRGMSLTEEEVLAYCRERLAAYKIPRLIEFKTELPRSSIGKILRHVLQKESAQSDKI